MLVTLVAVDAAPAKADTSFGEQQSPQAGYLRFPGGVGVNDASGAVYVTDGLSHHQVDEFGPAGASLFAFGWGVENEAEEEQTCTSTCALSPFRFTSVNGALLATPQAVAVDQTTGDVYVSDSNYQRIEKFAADGTFLYALAGDAVAYGPDDSTNNEVQKVTVVGTGGSFRLAFEYPWARAYRESTIRPQTASIAFGASAAAVKSALEALPTVNGTYVSGGSVTVTRTEKSATEFEYEVTFEGTLGGDDLPQLETFGENLAGASHSVTAQTLSDGGGAEVCKSSAGDVCKQGGDIGSGLNGTFANWPENEGNLAVGSTGTLYVGDENRVEEFSSEGAYTGQVNVPGGGKTRAVAVDSSGDVYVISAAVSGVQEFDSLGAPVRTLHPPGEPQFLATDAAGDLFAGTELNAGTENAAYEIAGYKPDGTHYAQLQSPLILPTESRHEHFSVGGLAIGNASGKIYVSSRRFEAGSQPAAMRVVVMDHPQPGPPGVGEESATDIEPETATLHARVNPKGFDTHYHFEYGETAAYGHSTASTDIGLVIENRAVQAALSALKPETTYHYRVVAENSEGTVDGTDQTFETLPPVSVRNFTTQTVGPELVTLKAELNPNGSATRYTIHIGEDTGYLTASSEGDLPIGNEFEEVTATFNGLKPHTSYHYQLVAENGYVVNGVLPVRTPDQTLETELSASEERAAEDCPNGSIHGASNSTLREENNSLTLPDCRAYEQTTIADKNGGEVVGGWSLAPSGDRVLYQSGGIFAETAIDVGATAEYLAQRSQTGWTTQAVIKRVAPLGWEPGSPITFGASAEMSPELDRWIYMEQPGSSQEEAEGTGTEGYYTLGSVSDPFVSQATPLFSLVEGPRRQGYVLMRVEAAANDFSRAFIVTGSRLLPGPADPRPDNPLGDPTRIYEVSGVGGPSPTISLAAEVPVGLTGSGCNIDSQSFDAPTMPGSRAVTASTDGRTLIFTSPIQKEAGKPCGTAAPNPYGIFARIDGAAAVQLNAPPATQCTAGHPCDGSETAMPLYYGMSPDGKLVWFTTNQPLVNADADGTTDLYVARLENGQLAELKQASGGGSGDSTPGSGASVQGVAGVSRDGSRAAFVATGALTTQENSEHQSAVAGADNLYVYDANSGETTFVADLCSGPEASGSTADSRCPAKLNADRGAGSRNDQNLWSVGTGSASLRLTPGGKDLLFPSWGQLTSDDTDTVEDVYRFDVETGELSRVSLGRNGNDANGNDDLYPAEIPAEGTFNWKLYEYAEDSSRAISADGSTAIFKTAAPLVSHDVNAGSEPGCASEKETGCDVYEWEEQGHGTCTEPGGCISLISDGVNPQGIRGNPVISSSGRDIAFRTRRNEIPADTDGVGDVYDAREGGGFPHVPSPGMPCEEGSPERCHGEGTNESLLGSYTSEETHHLPEGEKEHLECAKGKHKVRRHGQVRCVANKTRKHKHHRRRARRAVNAHRGGKS